MTQHIYEVCDDGDLVTSLEFRLHVAQMVGGEEENWEVLAHQMAENCIPRS